MAVSTGTRKRSQPSTHPSVFLGLLLAIAGLLLAMYAYTGTRIYDRTFAYVAIGGGILALSGIMVSAWGRAIMAARAQRARRVAVRQSDEQQRSEENAAEERPRRGLAFGRRKVAEERAPPTVAAPAEKKRALIPALPKLGRRAKERETGTNGARTFFAFKRKPDDAPSAGGPREGSGPLVTEERDPTADGAVVRITLRCPECNAEFAAEGVQPLTVTCPSCKFSGTV